MNILSSIFSVIVILVVLYLVLMVISWLFSTIGSTTLHDATKERTVSTDKGDTNYTFSVWFFVSDWSTKGEKPLLRRGHSSPYISLGAVENTLTVSVECYAIADGMQEGFTTTGGDVTLDDPPKELAAGQAGGYKNLKPGASLLPSTDAHTTKSGQAAFNKQQNVSAQGPTQHPYIPYKSTSSSVGSTKSGAKHALSTDTKTSAKTSGAIAVQKATGGQHPSLPGHTGASPQSHTTASTTTHSVVPGSTTATVDGAYAAGKGPGVHTTTTKPAHSPLPSHAKPPTHGSTKTPSHQLKSAATPTTPHVSHAPVPHASLPTPLHPTAHISTPTHHTTAIHPTMPIHHTMPTNPAMPSTHASPAPIPHVSQTPTSHPGSLIAKPVSSATAMKSAMQSPGITGAPIPQSLHHSTHKSGFTAHSVAPNSTSAGLQHGAHTMVKQHHLADTTSKSSGGAGKIFNCTIENCPLQAWVNLVVSVYGHTLDIYIDGKLLKSCTMPGIAVPSSTGNALITPDGGFTGRTAKVDYWPTASNAEQAYMIYLSGGGIPTSQSQNDSYSVRVSFLENGKEEGGFSI